MAISVNMESFDMDSKEVETTFQNLTFRQNSNVEVSYDGGRLNVYCNGTEVLSTMLAGNDFSLQLTGK